MRFSVSRPTVGVIDMSGLLQRVRELRSRFSRGDELAVSECADEFGLPVRRLVRHMLRTGCFTGELGTIVQQILKHLGQWTRSREELITEVCRQVCLAMVGSNLESQYETEVAYQHPTAVSA